MTISGYSNAIVGTMLGWLKGLANWVLRLFNLAGSVSVSPLAWLSRNWLKLLIVFMIIGVAADILVWLVRWRPHWVWFRKERVIVNDDSFFSSEGLKSEEDWEEDLEKNWHERDYVVASTVVKRPDSRRSEEGGDRRRPDRDGRPSTLVKRHAAEDGRQSRRGDEDYEGASGSFVRGERRHKAGFGRANAEAERKARRLLAEREADVLDPEGRQANETDFYEDEVFNVSNLPRTDDYPYEESDGE